MIRRAENVKGKSVDSTILRIKDRKRKRFKLIFERRKLNKTLMSHLKMLSRFADFDFKTLRWFKVFDDVLISGKGDRTSGVDKKRRGIEVRGIIGCKVKFLFVEKRLRFLMLPNRGERRR